MEHPIRQRVDDLARRRAEAEVPGVPRLVERQRSHGKLLARERIEYLLDPGTFHETDALARHRAGDALPERPYGDGVVTGWGTVDGRKVFVYSQDFTVFGGALGEVYGRKIHKVMDLAAEVGAPVIGLNDGGGARIQEGVVALVNYAGIAYRTVQCSGVVPQISAIMGPCAGGAVYCPIMTDLIFMVEGNSYMFVTGPDVVKEVNGEDVSREELGGPDVHTRTTGVVNFLSADDRACLDDIRTVLAYLPSNNDEEPPFEPTDDPVDRRCPELAGMVPAAPNRPYDMREVVRTVVDDGEFVEYSARFATNVICGFARLGGHAVGIVGNQPMVFAGVLDIDASAKAARFVRLCDAFNIPLVTFVDVPGFMPGVAQEHGAIIRHGAKLFHAFCEATVPRLSVITRKAYGGAYVDMNSKSIGCDLSLAWPTAELAVMGAQGAVGVLNRRELSEAEDREATRAELMDAYAENHLNPWAATDRGYVDDVIDPAETRTKLIAGLELLRNKREQLPLRKHANIPL
jgi:acetyl-CoA carboxylase carboxyltransferase component